MGKSEKISPFWAGHVAELARASGTWVGKEANKVKGQRT